jgi:hypothetical protein
MAKSFGQCRMRLGGSLADRDALRVLAGTSWRRVQRAKALAAASRVERGGDTGAPGEAELAVGWRCRNVLATRTEHD